jgi:hypothetical protein
MHVITGLAWFVLVRRAAQQAPVTQIATTGSPVRER